MDGSPRLQRPRPKDVGPHAPYAEAYADVLTASQREALRSAATTYLDGCFMSLEETPYDQSLVDTHLGASCPSATPTSTTMDSGGHGRLASRSLARSSPSESQSHSPASPRNSP